MSNVRILSAAPLLLLEYGLAVMPLLENGAISSPCGGGGSPPADDVSSAHATLSFFFPLLPFARGLVAKGMVSRVLRGSGGAGLLQQRRHASRDR